MKKILLIFSLFVIGVTGYSQEGEQHKIVEIFDLEKVRINVGSEIDIRIGDVFQVFGKGQVIHPATGKLIVRENVYLGKIEVIEVRELSSIAKVLEAERQFAIGNKIVKVVSVEQEIIEEKKPVQGEFQNPRQRDYSETIYTTQKSQDRTYPSIINIEVIKGDTIATVDKGESIKSIGGKPKVGSRYYLWVSDKDTSDQITFKKIGKFKYIGDLRLFEVQQLKSLGLLRIKKADYTYNEIKKNNKLMKFVPKTGVYFIGKISVWSWLDFFGETAGSPFGLHIEAGYNFNPHLSWGAGLRFCRPLLNNLRWTYQYGMEWQAWENGEEYYYWEEAEDFASFSAMPIFTSLNYEILNKRHSPAISFRVGISNFGNNKLESSESEINLTGGIYYAPCVYYKFYFSKSSSLLIGAEMEFFKYNADINLFNTGNPYDEEISRSDGMLNLFVGIKF